MKWKLRKWSLDLQTTVLELVKHQNIIIDIRMIHATPRRPFSKVLFSMVASHLFFFVENITI
jgi:hypothetical protein